MPVSERKAVTSDCKFSDWLFIMLFNVSAIEDKSSLLYEGRANIFSAEDIHGMENADWRERLAHAIKATGKSDRSLSLAAGLGPGYVHSIFKEGKDPTIANLVAVCRVVGVSLSWVLYGLEISSETEEIVRLLETRPKSREAVLQILREAPASALE